MNKARCKVSCSQPDGEKILLFTSRSGLEVNAYDSVWRVLPNVGKGSTLNVKWVHSREMSEEDRWLILDVFMFYARTKAASTASGIIINVKPFLVDGIPSLARINGIWSGLKTNQKKGLNQFFGTLKRHGHSRFEIYHSFTSTHLDKIKSNSFDPQKGALTDLEFDSLAKKINIRISEIDWDAGRDLYFYQSSNGFAESRNSISNKLLISIVRRPIQISIMKWSDLIPVGARFQDYENSPTCEIGSVGSTALQLRVFIAKSKGSLGPRESPERYPIYLSEELSQEIIQYKRVYLEGVKLLMKSCGIQASYRSLVQMMNDMPMFPSRNLFETRFNSVEEIAKIFTRKSTAYHVSDAAITFSFSRLTLASDRVANGNATSNRIRHTVMTRGAQDGLPAVQLAKLTGVTVPAARHYIDLDYRARRLIDSNYIGNNFLSQLFNPPISKVEADDEHIVDSYFNPVGIGQKKRVCTACSTSMGKPLGCYGCPNFRPILEADHRALLAVAEEKRAINYGALVNPLHTRSIEKLDKQIERLKCTIAFCDEILSKRKSIDVE